MERLEQLTRTAAADRPTLIVWPESAIPGNLHSDPMLIARLQSLIDTIGIPLILGAAEVEKFAAGDSEIRISRRAFNTAHLIRPGEPLAQPYRKRMLVPFAEYLPHPDIIPWPEWLAPRVSEMTPGASAQLFNLTTDLSVGALICWENVFAPLSRESVRNGAHLIVQLTNDVWFGRSAAPWQHNLMSVMRAVENRVPIVIASNTGPSQIIDGYGRVVASAKTIFTKGLATGSIHTGAGGTVYTAVGDVFVFGVLALLGMALVVPMTGLWSREKRPFAWLPGGRRSTSPLKCYVTETIIQIKPDGGT
jgi:apolipoprotein N-acyltransferase